MEEARAEAAGAVSSVYIARVYEALGEPDQALDWLERALEEGDPMVVGVRTRWLALPGLEGLPRYEAVLAQLPGDRRQEQREKRRADAR